MTKPEFAPELIERCCKALIDADPTMFGYHGTMFGYHELHISAKKDEALAVLRASGYAGLVEALEEARPFVGVFTTDSSYTGVSSPKEVLAHIDAALAAVKLCSKP